MATFFLVHAVEYRLMKSTILPSFFLLVQVAHAQMLPQKVEPSVSKSVVQRLITGLDGYVFPDKAHEMKEYLQQHMSSYETITDPQVLATRLTDDIRSVARDKHLTVAYSDLAKEAEGTADPADQKKMHRIEEASGFGISTVSRLPGNIGLLDMSYFSDDPEAAVALDGAMALLNGSDALIIDMRRNMGGNPIMVERLLTYLFSEQVQLTSVVWREGGKERTDQQWTLVYVPGPRMAGIPVFVLTSAKTFSAGEQLAYDLKTLNRATLIGETTGGGANPAAATVRWYGLNGMFVNRKLPSLPVSVCR